MGQAADTLENLDMLQVQLLAEHGHDDRFMARFFGVSESSWERWKKSHPEFFENLSQWKVIANARVERALYERAIGSTVREVTFEATGRRIDLHMLDDDTMESEPEYRKRVVVKQLPPDTGAAFIWMKNRVPEEWRDRYEFKQLDSTLGDAVKSARKQIMLHQADRVELGLIEAPKNGESK